jgi:Icc-related predicted phosphoesterase
MNDFEQIPFLTTKLVKERHHEHVRFLRENVWPGDLVMTHFAPSLRSLPDGSREQEAAGYYASDLETLILDLQPAVWVHGHIHTARDYTVGSTRILCNPAGYNGKDHNPALSFNV